MSINIIIIILFMTNLLMKYKFCVHDMSDITSKFCTISFCNILYILFSHAYVLSSYTI